MVSSEFYVGISVVGLSSEFYVGINPMVVMGYTWWSYYPFQREEWRHRRTTAEEGIL